MGASVGEFEVGTSASRWPALVTRTSGELLGRRPLPRLIAQRPLVFVLGPPGVGKSAVGRRLVGGEGLELGPEALRQALNHAARHGHFPEELRDTPALLLDRVDYLDGRYGAVELFGRFLQGRIDEGRRTVICQGADTTCVLVGASLPHCTKATLLLRFPVGRGRRRYVANRCRARGLSYTHARAATSLDPWSYAAVEAFLDSVGRG